MRLLRKEEFNTLQQEVCQHSQLVSVLQQISTSPCLSNIGFSLQDNFMLLFSFRLSIWMKTSCQKLLLSLSNASRNIVSGVRWLSPVKGMCCENRTSCALPSQLSLQVHNKTVQLQKTNQMNTQINQAYESLSARCRQLEKMLDNALLHSSQVDNAVRQLCGAMLNGMGGEIDHAQLQQFLKTVMPLLSTANVCTSSLILKPP